MENIDKFIKRFFYEPAQIYINNNLEFIINKLKNSKKIELNIRHIELNDIRKKLQDDDYLSDQYIISDDNKITLMYLTEKLKEELKKDVYEELEEISLSDEFLEDITLLEKFPNINKLVLKSDKLLNNDVIEYIKENTKIKTIEVESNIHLDYKNISLKQEDFLVTKPYLYLKNDDLEIYKKDSTNVPKLPNLYEDELEIMLSDDNISYKDIKKIYDKIKGKEKIKKIRVLMQSNNDKKEICKMELSENKQIKTFFYNCEESIEKAHKLYEEIEKELKIENVTLKMDNKNYEKLYLLGEISKKSNLEIDYDNNPFLTCSLEEFKGMRETLNWFNDNVKDADFSPLEKILYIYDLVKTFEYNENLSNKFMSRELHNIINSDYMVCVGFSKLLNQILKENGIKSEILSIKCTVNGIEYGHQRNLVKIDDDKYNIHGIFSLDATFDRNNYYKNGQGEKYYVDEIYHNFLVPPSEYQRMYSNETIPSIMKIKTQEDIITGFTTQEKNKLIISLFGENYHYEDVIKYINTKQIGLDKFKCAFRKVKKYEGYIDEDINIKDENTEKLNKMLDTDKTTLFQENIIKK